MIRRSLANRRYALGTFQDNLTVPIHRWFRYPTGFSYRAVEAAIHSASLRPGTTIYDPFVGTGTTLVVARSKGIDSIGVEAHPFIFKIAQTKLFWDFTPDALTDQLTSFLSSLEADVFNAFDQVEVSQLPKLVLDSFDRQMLHQLVALRNHIALCQTNERFRDLCNLALAAILRKLARVETGWSYILPRRPRTPASADVIQCFSHKLTEMCQDLLSIVQNKTQFGQARLILGDARTVGLPRDSHHLRPASLDLAFTSPPYLNNYDYADRTRLEMYFFGLASSWSDITHQVRDKLVVSATTQVTRTGNVSSEILGDVRQASPRLYKEIDSKCTQLQAKRCESGGRKNYDLMVAMYFRDILAVLNSILTVLKPGAQLVMILGDSAPYGVHIPTDRFVARLGRALGFASYRVYPLRERGHKWSNNGRRHQVGLRESLVVLTKPP